ncbi:MAG: GH92 family glycosyl hydrolase [Bacteroidales bacterium]|nr:GH92 family glycosyl hydrolase [Bacteroidales bacterium]MDY0140346.1 GH92 family glycosyl hydrolase [Bacteroidales bacterium]
MRRLIFPVSLAVIFVAILVYGLFFHKSKKFKIENRSQLVDPHIGTDFHGHTFPGATLPFGMVQLSPDTRLDGWDGCSGFHYSDSIIYGFSHTHLSGTGVADYADILIMPFVKSNPDLFSDDFTSKYEKTSVIAKPGYYSVYLKDYNIDVELTCSRRVGFHKYRFPKADEQYILLDLEHRDKLLECYVEQISNTRFVGLRRSQSWAENQYQYFVIDFNQAVSIADYKIFEQSDTSRSKNKIDLENIGKNNYSKLIFKINPTDSKNLFVKVGLSAVSAEGAIKNLISEIPDWDFEETIKKASNEWDKELSKILVYGATPEEQTVFYTALYHSFIAPNIFSDIDGSFRGTDNKTYKTKEHDTYTVFSLWDTYRGAHPLFTITQQERTKDFIKTFLDQYKYGGQLPVWELAANETMCMIGYHSVPVIVDAYFKGIRNFDAKYALEAMIAAAKEDRLGKPEFAKYGYIPLDMEHESVSKALEYAYDDWCIAQFAKAIGNTDTYNEFIERSQYYKNVFNPNNGFMQAKINAAWQFPFDPAEVNYNFTEANSWQYSFYVPQDILTFIEMHGGNEKFADKLDEMFSASTQTSGTHQVDITGLIGQYAHGNEPSHHMAYLYNYCAQPWKTQEVVRKIMSEQYSEMPDGLCGNEDCGQMSAWYVLSALGFYPVNPANGIYDLGSPVFDTAVLQLENHRHFTIIAHENSKNNIYVQSVQLNGRAYNKTYITHKQIMQGGKLEFFMGDKPNKTRGVNQEDIYVSRITENLISPVPYTNYQHKSFQDSIFVSLDRYDKDAKIFYSLNNDINNNPIKYEGAILIKKSTDLQAYSESLGKKRSKTVVAKYTLIPDRRTIDIKSKYSQQYSAGGDNALIDYVKGSNWFRSGLWQGYKGQNFEAVVDLLEVKDINRINARFLQDTKSWIFFPKKIRYFASQDGKNYSNIYEAPSTMSDKDEAVLIQEFIFKPENLKARYIKIIAENYGVLPAWHLSPGFDSWLFIDEIEIE